MDEARLVRVASPSHGRLSSAPLRSSDRECDAESVLRGFTGPYSIAMTVSLVLAT